VALRRCVSDNDTLIGFSHSEHSLDSGGSDAFSVPPTSLESELAGQAGKVSFSRPLTASTARKKRPWTAGHSFTPMAPRTPGRARTTLAPQMDADKSS